MNHLASLAKLLLEMASEAELRRWVAGLPEGKRIGQLLPARPESPAEFAHAVVELLDREGRIDAVWFSTLREARPARAVEIDRMAGRFGPSAASVAPVQLDPVRRGLAAELEAAHQARKNAALRGEPLAEWDVRILELRRKLREGPSLLGTAATC